MCTYAVNRKKEQNEKSFTYFVAEAGQLIQKLNQAQFDAFIGKLTSADSIRVLNIGIFGLLNIYNLKEKNVPVYSAHWHDLGIEKNLDTEKIVEILVTRDATLFKTYTVRPDLFEINVACREREKLIKGRNARNNSLRAAVQTLNLEKPTVQIGKRNRKLASSADELQTGELATAVAHEAAENKATRAVTSLFKALEESEAKEDKAFESSIDKFIEAKAMLIPEIQLFMKVAGVKEGVQTAAFVVSQIGDIDRFATVSKLWRYCGCWDSKLKAGATIHHSPVLKMVLLGRWARAAEKNNTKWMPILKELKAEELAAHAQKCGTKKKTLNDKGEEVCGHCAARARRKMVKMVLKQYWIEARKAAGLTLTEPYKEDVALATVV